jgi:hypothetical protein
MKVKEKIRISSGLVDWRIEVSYGVQIENSAPWSLDKFDQQKLDAIKSRIESAVGANIKDLLLEIKNGDE